MALLSAKAKAVEKFKQGNKDANVSEFKAKLVAYASCQSHSSVERAGLLGDVRMRLLEPDEDLSLRGKTLTKVSVKDHTCGGDHRSMGHLAPYLTSIGFTNYFRCLIFDLSFFYKC